MKVFMTGGTGFVGSYLAQRLAQRGHTITILSRSAKGSQTEGIVFVQGNPQEPGPWQERVIEHDVVINLAGSSIFTPWTQKARRTILESRVLTTRNLVDALAPAPGEILLFSGSAVGYYGSRDDDALLNESSPAGSDFLAEVAVAWEAEARRAEEFGVRVALCRFGIILGKGGGALAKMLPAFRYFVGAPLGSGRQWFPWLHIEDLLRILVFVSERRHLSGPINCVAPSPVRNQELTRALARALERPQIMPSLPGFVLRTLLGDFGDVVLKGQRAIPQRLLDEGFQFQFPTIAQALDNLVR